MRCDPGWKLCLVATGLFPDLTVVALLNDDSSHPVDAAWSPVWSPDDEPSVS